MDTLKTTMEKIIDIELEPFATTKYFDGVLQMDNKDYNFTISFTEDENENQSFDITWVDEIPDVKDLNKLETQIKNEF